MVNCSKHGLTEGLKSSGRCRLCNKERQNKLRRERKRQIVCLKGNKCQICGYNKTDNALTFHHLDPNKKEFALSAKNLGNTELEKIFKEIDKCVLLCMNCHAEVHAGITSCSGG